MATLTAAARAKLKPSQFAVPAGHYPIPDENHAHAALSMVSRFGSDEEQAAVRAAVARKFPGVAQEHADNAKASAYMNARIRGSGSR